jgi:RNA polymerase sigma-70 factor, ECF subfamily
VIQYFAASANQSQNRQDAFALCLRALEDSGGLFCLGNTFNSNSWRQHSQAPEAFCAEQLSAQTALTLFLRDHERRALRILQLGTKNTDDALDVLQEAMLAFASRYARLPKFEEAALRAQEWPKLFYTIVDSKLQDFRRRSNVRDRFRSLFGLSTSKDEEDFDLNQYADDSVRSPEREFSRAQFRPRVESALRKLPDRQRQAFLLRVWEGFDGAQTAEIMRCSEGSVKTHLFRALASLRESLADWQQNFEHIAGLRPSKNDSNESVKRGVA